MLLLCFGFHLIYVYCILDSADLRYLDEKEE